MPNRQLDAFFERMAADFQKVTYSDVRLPTLYSETLPHQTDLSTRFSRRVPLRIPVVSSAMDTVTEANMAIAMAKLGGIGVIHRGMKIKKQVTMVKRVKLHRNGLIVKPYSVKPHKTLAQVRKLQARKGFGFDSFPVIDTDGAFQGMITSKDFEFNDPDTLVSKAMTPFSEEFVFGSADTDRTEALRLMKEHKKSSLPLLDEDRRVVGMYVHSDLKRLESDASMHNVDENGQLYVAAAVGSGKKALKRAAPLVEAGCDVLVIDTAHGWSKEVIDTVRELKRLYPDVDIVAGNVSNGAGAKALADAGVDGILVGQGPGSICTTRIVAGVGCPQVSAVYDCVKAVEGAGVPVCADGGIQDPGDIAIALAIGASSVILGSILAATDASPGEVIQLGQMQVKRYRGMGSRSAMQDNAASRQKYGQSNDPAKIVPEGVDGHVLYKGLLADVLHYYVGGVRSSMGYLGSPDLKAFQANAELFRITNAGLKESHPHDLAAAA